MARITYFPWSLELLPHWGATDHPECVTLERSPEGALQLSSATKKSGALTDADLSQYAESQNDGWGTYVKVSCGDFTGLLYQYASDEMQCNRWFLRSGKTLLFVTYFATTRGQLMEFGEVERMIQTLRADTALSTTTT